MTREEIFKLAKYCWPSTRRMWSTESDLESLVLFASLIAATEREACADLCDKSDRYRGCYFAAKIRERGNIDKG